MKRLRTLSHSAGFTLAEMLTVVAVFVILTSVVLFNSRQFGEVILLENLAYDVAISVRQAQTYGLAVREAPGAGNSFDVAYGVHFSATDTTHFKLFADLDRDGVFDDPSGGSCIGVCDSVVEEYTVRRGNTISLVCASQSPSTQHCTTSPSPNNISSVDVTFNRPNPDALIASERLNTYDSAVIYVRSPSALIRLVKIQSTGQISVEVPPSEPGA